MYTYILFNIFYNVNKYFLYGALPTLRTRIVCCVLRSQYSPFYIFECLNYNINSVVVVVLVAFYLFAC